MSTFTPFAEKMESAGVSAAAVNAFSRCYEALVSNHSGMIPETDILPADQVEDWQDITASTPVADKDLISRCVCIKLNGGLGTSMGLQKAKSLLKVKGEDTFLDLIVRQVKHLRSISGTPVRLLLMNSFSTSADTLAYLEKYAADGFADRAEVELLQNRVPKILADGLSPASCPEQPELEWCPPGHGDLYPALLGSGFSAPEGSTLTLKVSASQRLQSAEDAQGQPLRVDGSSVIIPNILLEKEPREIELDWMDSDGLAASRPVKIRLEPIEDKQPSIYLRGGENDRYVLEDTSIELEVEAADDFGLREMGVEWQGEKSFYDSNEDENGASAPKPAGADKPAPGLRGEKVLADGQPTQTGLKGTFLFQARALKLSPQRVVIRGFTQDYKPGGRRVYSEPMIIFVLSKSEHAQMIRNELERITSELEGMIRRMDAMADEAKRLKGMESGKLKDAESQERLHALADEEQANRRELGDLLNRSESLFKEASRNSQIDPAGMKEFMKGISMLKPIPDGPMKMAQKQFRDSASESRSEQESRKDLNDGENSHSEATQALKDTMNQLSKSAQDMEASTFVARLRQAASKEDSIAHALAGQINTIAGMTMEELDPSTRREMETIATLQNVSTQDIGWILEDLSYYKSRTGERIYSDLYNQMNAFSLRDKLDLVHGNILNAITARSIDESRLYASTLRHWAKLIDDYKKSRRGGGGGGGGGGGSQSSISDAEFEFMLKLIRMIQQEQDIRMRTRAAEQEHRKKFTPPAP